MSDRRSGDDRRRADRLSVTVDIEWEMAGVKRRGTLGDLNEFGCFVLTSGVVTDGQSVRVLLPLSDGTSAPLEGEIANNVFEIGFGVRFEPLTPAQKDFVINFAALHSNK